MSILQWVFVSIAGGVGILIFIYAGAKLATAGYLHAKRDAERRFSSTRFKSKE